MRVLKLNRKTHKRGRAEPIIENKKEKHCVQFSRKEGGGERERERKKTNNMYEKSIEFLLYSEIIIDHHTFTY